METALYLLAIPGIRQGDKNTLEEVADDVAQSEFWVT